MCLMCGMNPEADPLSVYDTHDIGRGSGSGIGTVSLGTAVTGPATVNAPYTWDQIAGYLTDGYWAFNLGSWRAFDIGPSRTITYSLTHLSDAAAAIAEYALDVWAAVTGINFVDVSATPIAITEGADVGGAIGSSFGLSTNSVVSGSISSNGDMDYYRVTLVAGQTYMFSLSRGNGSTLDPVLSLLNSSGSVIATSDDPSSAAAGEYITFTATSTGTYYLVASDYSTRTGTYELTTEVAADLTFNDADGTGAYAWSDLSGNTILSSFINIPDNWDTLNLNGYMVQTYIHELGHALGLGHAGPYNGTANWGTGHTLYDNDSWSATIMSYFDQDTNTFDPASLAYLATIMPADIIAIQNLYGAGSVGYQTGNTIWGPGGNVGGAFQQLLNMWGGLVAANPAIYAGEDFAFTIYDTGGIDTLDVSVFGGGQMVNLNPLVRSNINGVTGNVVIARDTVIENATTGSGNDTVYGNNVANTIRTNGGNDRLYGGAGNDILIGGAGADILDGGAGTDRAHYADATAGIRVDLLSPGSNTGFAAGDTYISIEDVYGSNFNDMLLGDNVSNRIWGANGNDQIYGRNGNDSLYGGAGNDILLGGAGGDLLDGGAGRDRAHYSDATTALRIDLLSPRSNTGIAAGDTYVSIEDVYGSSYNDSIYGDNVSNVIWGADGNDVIYGRVGNDTIYGGNGNDTIRGGEGNDLLYGGAGADAFVFDRPLVGNVDRIADFSSAADTIYLDDAVFTALSTGALASSAFRAGSAATTAAHRIIYNQATGQIFYDADGSGGGAAVLFATVAAGTSIALSDFVVI